MKAGGLCATGKHRTKIKILTEANKKDKHKEKRQAQSKKTKAEADGLYASWKVETSV